MKIITYLLIGIIKIYKICISPIFPNSCRFEPTCSQYCIDSLKTYGLVKGLTKSIVRILKCNPWFGYGGYDPVRNKKEVK
tara:strand:+ start:499 stop:738 length:240 start_codon:yes stop_codon:yes gene_type:complete